MAKAGEKYVVAVKSGGFLGSRFRGGGMIRGAMGRGGGLGGLTGQTPPGQVNATRREALREGEVEIKDCESGKVVWKFHPDNLPMGMDESKFVEGLEEDLENCSIEEFQKRWRIEPEG